MSKKIRAGVFKRRQYDCYEFTIIHNGYRWIASDGTKVIEAGGEEGLIAFKKRLKAMKKRTKMKSDEEYEKYLKD